MGEDLSRGQGSAGPAGLGGQARLSAACGVLHRTSCSQEHRGCQSLGKAGVEGLGWNTQGGSSGRVQCMATRTPSTGGTHTQTCRGTEPAWPRAWLPSGHTRRRRHNVLSQGRSTRRGQAPRATWLSLHPRPPCWLNTMAVPHTYTAGEGGSVQGVQETCRGLPLTKGRRVLERKWGVASKHEQEPFSSESLSLGSEISSAPQQSAAGW